MRIALIGAVESTAVALKTMCTEGYLPHAVVTLPLSKASRHSDFVDLRELISKHHLQLIETTNVNNADTLEKLDSLDLDYIFVCGWSQILREDFFNLSKKGIIGYHPSHLPKNRGRAVLPWTILQGIDRTASTVFWIDKGVDSGDILLQEPVSVTKEETASSLYQKHMVALASLIKQMLPLIAQDNPPRIKQNHNEATYCAKRTPDDGLIDWTQSAITIHRLIRAASKPYPGAFTFYKGQRLIIWEAQLSLKTCYWGLPGQIQYIDNIGALVHCGDGKNLILTDIEFLNDNIKLKQHDILGISVLDLYQSMASMKEVRQ